MVDNPIILIPETDSRNGWAWPLLSKKPHYMVDGVALCRKWLYTGEKEEIQTTRLLPNKEDCVACHKKALKRVP